MSFLSRACVLLPCLVLTACDSGSDVGPVQYTLDVTAEGLTGELKIQNNGGNTLTVPSSGQFRFTGRLQEGQHYSVTVLVPPAGQACSVTRGSGVANGNVVDVRILCIPKRGVMNDTGVDWCADATNNNLSCPVAGLLRQDAEFGRDALAKAGSLVKVGAGHAGFDFTRLGSNGHPLLIQDASWSNAGVELAGTRWSCVRDNHTGLVWEVKDNDSASLHYHLNTYTWYDTNTATNGGSSGVAGGGVCNAGNCDTGSFVAAVNSAGLCGFNDWRMPTPREFETIIDFGTSQPAIDTDYFPNVSSNPDATILPHIYYWTSMPQAGTADTAFAMRSDFGNTQAQFHASQEFHVRLVRSAP